MYVGMRHFATQATTEQGRYFCPSCGFEADVAIESVGTAYADAPFFLGQARARAAAAADAPGASWGRARRALALVACPRCKSRDASARAVTVVTAAIGPGLVTLIVAPVAGLLAGVIFAPPYVRSIVALFLAAGAAMAAFFVVEKVREAQGWADAQVTFLEAPSGPTRRRKRKRRRTLEHAKSPESV